MAVGEGMVGVTCSETILGEGAGVGAGSRVAPVAAAFWAAPGGMGGFWAELGGLGGGRKEEVGGAFLAGEGRGALDRRKPGSDNRLEEERSGPGGGAAPLPRKEKLPPELIAAARRFCWKTSRLPCRRRDGWWLSSPRDSRHFLTCAPHSRSIRDSLTGRVTICGGREDTSAEVRGSQFILAEVRGNKLRSEASKDQTAGKVIRGSLWRSKVSRGHGKAVQVSRDERRSEVSRSSEVTESQGKTEGIRSQ